VTPRPPQIRIPSDSWSQIRAGLTMCSPGREPVVFALASSAKAGAETIVPVKRVVIPPDDAFRSSTHHGAMWTGSYNIELLNRCLAEQLGLLIFHEHGSDPVRMSGDDKASADRVMARFQTDLPGRVHGSVVFGKQTVDGRLWLPGSDSPRSAFSVRVLGSRISNYPLPMGADVDVFVKSTHRAESRGPRSPTQRPCGSCGREWRGNPDNYSIGGCGRRGADLR